MTPVKLRKISRCVLSGKSWFRVQKRGALEGICHCTACGYTPEMHRRATQIVLDEPTTRGPS